MNQSKIEISILIISLFGLMAPFSSLNTEFSLWSQSLGDNWATWSSNSLLNYKNPVWFILHAIMYQIILLLENMVPAFIGTGNNFIVRFFFKLPLIISYIIVAILTEKLIYQQTKDKTLATWGFFLSLVNLPLFYTVAILGSAEAIIWLFFLLSLLLLTQTQTQTQSNYILGGIFFAVALSFNFILIFFLLIFVFQISSKNYLWFLTGLVITLSALIVPWLLFSQQIGIVSNSQPMGWSLFLVILGFQDHFLGNLLNLIHIIIFFIMLFGLPFVFSKQVIQQIKIMDSIILLSVILLIATPFLTLSDFLLLQQPLIIAIFYNTNQKVGIKLPLNQVKITIPSNYGILASFFFLEISFLLISYPTNEIYHIIVVQVSVLGKFLQVLEQIKL